MRMKFGVVGPQEVVDKIISVINNEFHQIEPIPFVYQIYTEVPGLIGHAQAGLDAILFAGSTPWSYAEKSIKPTIPWEFIPRSGSSLLEVLLQIALSGKYDVYRISSDVYGMDQLTETYAEIGLEKERVHIHTPQKTSTEADYIDFICGFHEQCYQNNLVSCCITAFYHVHERLKAKNIPCFLVRPTFSIIRQTLHKLQLRHIVQVSQQSQIVALFVRIETPDEYSMFTDNEYQYVIDKTNVARQVYLYAQRLKAAVVEVGAQEFLLFSTRHLLESVTDNYEHIDLLQDVKRNTASSISIGVGHGKTAQEAKANAHLGMVRASKLGGNAAFIVCDETEMIGPIYSSDGPPPDHAEQKIDRKFLLVSEKAGISVNTVFRLQGVLMHEGRTRFTATELATLMGVSSRTMNRILVNLSTHGFCREVGKRVLAQAGRPSRIVEIFIP